MGDHGDHPDDLLRRAVAALGSRALCAGPGDPGRSGPPPLLHVCDRDLAPGVLLRRRTADHGRYRTVPGDQRRGARLVRLCLPADRLDRPVPACRPLHRRGSQRPTAPAQGTVDRRQGGPPPAQVVDLSRHLVLDWRRLDHVLRRRTDPGARILDRPGRPGGLWLGRGADLHHLLARRLHARAGVHLHVPLAAHPGRDARREEPDRHLQGLARRAARQRQAGGQGPRGLR